MCQRLGQSISGENVRGLHVLYNFADTSLHHVLHLLPDMPRVVVHVSPKTSAAYCWVCIHTMYLPVFVCLF